MRINELKVCPQWLLDAKTLNADVEMINGRVVWLNGEWRGGVWWDGEWRGGVWWDGEWLGGEWLGGEWLGQKDGPIDIGSCEGYRKVIAPVEGVAYIRAGCRWMTLAEAKEHWKRIRGWRES